LKFEEFKCAPESYEQALSIAYTPHTKINDRQTWRRWTRTRTRTITNPNGTEANAAGRSVPMQRVLLLCASIRKQKQTNTEKDIGN